ncbi:cyclin-T2 isoform X2 [Diachasmimorpha longicaudata]|uniref:cyclin-T2 isoform X2 n=1 Tax=Diachasmimorpha longicaudata TaxID=58733 RepID=UPI0030B91C65
MAADEKWYFTKEQLASTPSRRNGIDADKELSYRQQAANFIQDMGQRLVVTQLCINTAIVYMHRFYVFHSLAQFHRNAIAAASLFLAAKVEEQPRKLEHVIKVAHMCLHKDQNTPDTKSDVRSMQCFEEAELCLIKKKLFQHYLEQAQDLVFNENVLLQTLGFDVAIDHPHTHVVRCCQLVKASKDLAQTSYFMASNSLHLTTMCLQYKPTVVACFCIHLACKWSNWEIPQSNEGKHWFWYVDRTVTSELLQQLTVEFLHIFDRCPSRLKKKIMSMSEKQSPTMHHPSLPNSPFDVEPRKVNSPAPDGGPTFQSARPFPQEKDESKPSTSRPQLDREYREKKERERLEREKLGNSLVSHDPQKHHHQHHHKPPQGLLPKHLPPSSKPVHHNHHHRPDPKLPQPPQRHSQSRQRPPGLPHPSQNPPPVPQPQQYQKDPNLVSAPLNPPDHQDLEKVQNNHLHRRYNDPRHKLIEQRKEEPKSYSSQIRQRKPDSLEQRSEEVRKLIEKPLPPPKPRQELTKEDYIATMMKQSHHPSKYQDKPIVHNSGRNVQSHEFQKTPTVALKPQVNPGNLQIPQKDQKNGIDEIRQLEKRLKPEELIPKHKSLFSPEKTPREPVPRPKPPKQKTPPMLPVKAIKTERIPEGHFELPGSFPSPPQPLNPQKRPEDRVKIEDSASFDLVKMFGKLPEPLQSLGSTNGRGDLKQEKPFDTDHILTNGMDFETKTDLDHLILERLDSGLKTEYLSPMKSAQSISALLQEPLALMPSLLQPSDSGTFSQPFSQITQSESLQNPVPEQVKEEIFPSTVDISALSGPVQALPDVTGVPSIPQQSEKKSEHHKSEKKKKKDKHKHKDKDRHKHKHKDKDKEKRDKDKKDKEKSKVEENSTVPIKITIPKDKLNLSTDNSSQERKSPSATKLTLKIPKERLQPGATGPTVAKDAQGSLKIKIRTSGAGVEFPESRKRERERETGDTGPVSKKSAGQQSGQQRTNDRQNGKHYGTTSNKEKHTREHKSSSKLSQSQQSHTT